MILRTFTRNLLRVSGHQQARHIDYAVCIDIECTCDEPVQISPMEVIEIACLKVDLRSNHNSQNQDATKVQSALGLKPRASHLDSCPKFHSFVKPVIHPELTLFCQELTGVTQSTVDRARPIEQVIDDMCSWLQDQELIDTNYNLLQNFAFASCGNFDLALLSPIIGRYKFDGNQELPIYFREWINVKKTFVNHKREWPKGLYHMLEILGVEPLGRLHSAEDDCKNLARIVECLRAEGCKFQITSRARKSGDI